MNHRVGSRIAKDILDEFGKLRTELGHYTEPEADVSHARQLLAEHVPKMVLARAQLLLDTLLNYLMEDTADALAGTPTEVQNEFYDLDLRDRVRKSFTLEPESLELSIDPRLMCGGLAASATLAGGGLATALFLCSLLSRIVGGLATLVASAVAFKITYAATTDMARKRLQADVEGYLTRSEQQVSLWLAHVEEYFIAEFTKFREGEERSEGGEV